jgi:ABC-type transport system involved in Fe-S cluster assembly fused permease/ATPase subunit
VTSETFSNFYNVKYFQKEKAELEKYRGALTDYYAKNHTVQFSLGVLNTLQRVIFGTGLTVNMMMAAHFVQVGLLTTGDIMMIQTLMLQFLSPLFFLGTMYRSFDDNLIDIRKIRTIMETPCSVQEGTNNLETVQGHIQFRNVHFKYINESNHVLLDLNFDIPANKFIGIVGKSGIGKTTILNLIFRLYDPQ